MYSGELLISALWVVGGHHISRPAVHGVELVGEFAHVIPDLGHFFEVSGPVSHAIGRLLVLQSLQNGLVLQLNLHHGRLSGGDIETALLAA